MRMQASNGMINLLPKDALARARREYYARLIALSLFSLAAVFLSSAAFLIPSYLFARIERDAVLTRVGFLSTAASGEKNSAQSAELARTGEFLAATQVPGATVAGLLGELLAARPAEVTLSHISFEAGDPSRFSISGVARSREPLLAFRNKLEEAAAFESVELPVSNLAKAADISFSMTVRIARPATPRP